MNRLLICKSNRLSGFSNMSNSSWVKKIKKAIFLYELKLNKTEYFGGIFLLSFAGWGEGEGGK